MSSYVAKTPSKGSPLLVSQHHNYNLTLPNNPDSFNLLLHSHMYSTLVKFPICTHTSSVSKLLNTFGEQQTLPNMSSGKYDVHVQCTSIHIHVNVPVSHSILCLVYPTSEYKYECPCTCMLCTCKSKTIQHAVSSQAFLKNMHIYTVGWGKFKRHECNISSLLISIKQNLGRTYSS